MNKKLPENLTTVNRIVREENARLGMLGQGLLSMNNEVADTIRHQLPMLADALQRAATGGYGVSQSVLAISAEHEFQGKGVTGREVFRTIQMDYLAYGDEAKYKLGSERWIELFCIPTEPWDKIRFDDIVSPFARMTRAIPIAEADQLFDLTRIKKRVAKFLDSPLSFYEEAESGFVRSSRDYVTNYLETGLQFCLSQTEYPTLSADIVVQLENASGGGLWPRVQIRHAGEQTWFYFDHPSFIPSGGFYDALRSEVNKVISEYGFDYITNSDSTEWLCHMGTQLNEIVKEIIALGIQLNISDISSIGPSDVFSEDQSCKYVFKKELSFGYEIVALPDEYVFVNLRKTYSYAEERRSQNLLAADLVYTNRDIMFEQVLLKALRDLTAFRDTLVVPPSDDNNPASLEEVKLT